MNPKPNLVTKSDSSPLTEEELRIWIAEKCGWKREEKEFHRRDGPVIGRRWFHPEDKGNQCNGEFGKGFSRKLGVLALPDYTRDLNAMGEAVKILTSTQREAYIQCLERLTFCFTFMPASNEEKLSWMTEASATDRAKAFYLATK